VQLLNETPFAAATMPWEDLEGRAKLTVIVKSTFGIEPRAETAIASSQLPVLFADENYSKDPISSVRFESDMAPFKPKADIVLVGKAFAPEGKTVRGVDVSLAIGRLRKTIRVIGDRKWWFPTRFLILPIKSPTKKFTTMDLVYERAFGGVYDGPGFYCKENLAGTGYIRKKRKKAIHKKRLPNLEDPNHLIRWWRSKPKPVGFGFYGRGWHPRAKYAGTYDERYQKERAPAMPEDFSYAFYNAAHPDLQVEGYLRGDEDVELINLSPEPRLRFRLPGIQPKITVARWTVSPEKWIEENATEDREVSIDDVPTTEESVTPVLDTLVFIPDEGIFYEVFRGVCSLNSLDQPEVARIRITM
jgi:hypothetical protein